LTIPNRALLKRTLELNYQGSCNLLDQLIMYVFIKLFFLYYFI
jgi:hypothetical protein